MLVVSAPGEPVGEGLEREIDGFGETGREDESGEFEEAETKGRRSEVSDWQRVR
jgi:hypothetical protein